MYQSEDDDAATVLEPHPMPNFVETRYIKDITNRALVYIKCGFPIHLRGASGTGKTTLAFHIANKLARPVVLIHGDEQYSTKDFIGGEQGYRYKRLRDNFISSVLKEEESMSKTWIDSRMVDACRYGFTLVYDEYTRSRPEANNILLPILQEKTMSLPPSHSNGEAYLKVDPKFTAIFTSNPEEYAGTHKSADALRDRMVTIDLDYFDRKTEVEITRTKSDLTVEEAGKIVDIVRGLRKTGAYDFAPTVRGCIMIAKAIKTSGAQVMCGDAAFRQICEDVLSSETSRLGEKTTQQKVKKIVNELINQYCGAYMRPSRVASLKASKVSEAKTYNRERKLEKKLKPIEIRKIKKEMGPLFELEALEEISSLRTKTTLT